MEQQNRKDRRTASQSSNVREGFRAAGRVIDSISDWLFRLRKILLSLPVIVVSVYLAVLNSKRLPETVGIGLQETGEFLQTVPRQVAVFGPLAITAVCLLLMLCSKKTLYPWLISVFTLVLPVFVWFVATFPG